MIIPIFEIIVAGPKICWFRHIATPQIIIARIYKFVELELLRALQFDMSISWIYNSLVSIYCHQLCLLQSDQADGFKVIAAKKNCNSLQMDTPFDRIHGSVRFSTQPNSNTSDLLSLNITKLIRFIVKILRFEKTSWSQISRQWLWNSHQRQWLWFLV